MKNIDIFEYKYIKYRYFCIYDFLTFERIESVSPDPTLNIAPVRETHTSEPTILEYLPFPSSCAVTSASSS